MPTPLSPQWIRGQVDELAIAKDCYFDEAAGLKVCAFIETFCRQSKGDWKGEPLRLLPWQRDFLMRLFGWKRADGRRRYKRAYLEVAKKNGKSTLISGIGLYLLLMDGEGSPEIYLNACDKSQAAIVFEEQRRMVEASPAMADRLKIRNNPTDMRIIHPAGNGAIIVNSSVAASKDGLNPSGTLFDELHRQPDRQLWDVFEYAGSARRQPLRLSISTAGEEESGVWFEERQYAEKVNDGTNPDIHFLGVIYRALPEDDIDDPATWAKANPSLGVTIRPEDFREELEEAKLIPVKLANFKRLRLNIVCHAAAKFLEAGRWERCPNEPEPLASLIGLPCYMGLDLASVNDLAALVIILGDTSDGFDLLCRFWLPKDNILALEHQHAVSYRVWADQGFLTLTPGEVIDFDFIRAEVVKLARLLGLKKLMIDPYQAQRLGTQLMEHDGLPVEFLPQNYYTLAVPTSELQRLVLTRKINHGGNPVLRWMASNAVAEQDHHGNLKLSKKKSRLKIDGMAALVNAIAGAMADATSGSSVYEERGLTVL